VTRGGDEEPTVEGGIEASQVSIRASWPSSSGIVEMERDGERWRGMERDGEGWREMERDGDGDVNGRIRFGPDVLRHSRPSNVSTTWDIKTLHIIKLCNFLAR
jgi:hypothetical protein